MQLFCYLSFMVIIPHGVAPVQLRIQTETNTTKRTRVSRQLAIIYWQLVQYQLLIFRVFSVCDPSGSWRAALVPKMIPPGLLPFQKIEINTSHCGYMPCCTVLLLPLHQRDGLCWWEEYVLWHAYTLQHRGASDSL